MDSEMDNVNVVCLHIFLKEKRELLGLGGFNGRCKIPLNQLK